MNALDGISIPSALVGQLVVFALVAILVYALAREAARMVIRPLLVVGVLLAVAVMLGWLDQSVVGRMLERVGDWLIGAFQATARWVAGAWERMRK